MPATAVTAAQLREVVARIIDAGHWQPGDPNILIVTYAGYDLTRLAFVLADLPIDVLGRIRSDRAMLRSAPPRRPGTTGRTRKRGGVFTLAAPPQLTRPRPHYQRRHRLLRHARAQAWAGCARG